MLIVPLEPLAQRLEAWLTLPRMSCWLTRTIRRNNKIKVSKGDKVSKINRWSGVLVMLRGLWRKGPGKGRVWQPHTLPSEVRGTRGGGFSSGFVYLFAHGARRDWSAWHPGPTAVSRVRFVRTEGPAAHVSGSTEFPPFSLQGRGRDRSLE